MQNNTKLLKNTIFYSIGDVLPRVITLLLLPVYTRYLSPSDYGIISYTQTIITFLSVLGTFSLNTYVLRYYFVYEDQEERRELLGTAQLSIIILNSLILALAFMLMPNIIDWYNVQVPWNPYFKYAYIINYIDCLSIIPLVIYRIRQDAIKYVLLGLSRTILTVLLTLYLVVYKKEGLIGVFQAQLFVLLPYALLYLIILRKYSKLIIRWEYIKEGFKFSSPLIPGAIGYLLLSISDRIILERNVGLDDLGIYNVACQMSLALSIVVRSGYRSVEPELFQCYGKEGFFDFVGKIQRIFFYLCYVGALLISLFSQEVFKIMTSEVFHNGYFLVPALIVGVVMTGQNLIYGGVLLCEKRTKIQGLVTIIGAAISVLLNLLMIPLFGTHAAAVTSAFSFFIMNTILFFSMTWPGKTMRRELLLVILIPCISYLLFYVLGEISLVGIIVKCIVVVLYAVLAAWLLRIDIYKLRNFFIKER